jgi:hypothetical protein
MTFKDAKKLRNGDEVLSKFNDVIKVLEIEVVTDGSYGSDAVIITGISSGNEGYGKWHHTTVR